VCRACGKAGIDESWRFTACSYECYRISEIVHQHFYGEISDDEALDALYDVPLFDETKLTPDMADYLSNKLIGESAEPSPQ
jgi:hypothetical protein